MMTLNVKSYIGFDIHGNKMIWITHYCDSCNIEFDCLECSEIADYTEEKILLDEVHDSEIVYCENCTFNFNDDKNENDIND